MTHMASETKGKKPMLNSKGSEEHIKKLSETTTRDRGTEIDDVVVGSGELRENASNQGPDFLKVQRSPEFAETGEEGGSETTDQKETEKLDRLSTWDED